MEIIIDFPKNIRRICKEIVIYLYEQKIPKIFISFSGPVIVYSGLVIIATTDS